MSQYQCDYCMEDCPSDEQYTLGMGTTKYFCSPECHLAYGYYRNIKCPVPYRRTVLCAPEQRFLIKHGGYMKRDEWLKQLRSRLSEQDAAEAARTDSKYQQSVKIKK